MSPRKKNRGKPRAKLSARSRAERRRAARRKPASKSPSPRQAGQRARPPGALFDDLVALQARLLSPQGCPWDREQTHESLRTYLLEETYEVLDALDSGNAAQFAGELGDLLLQIVFHARLAEQAGRFTICDVIERIHTKMVRRHPHVFAGARAKTSAEVLKNWEQLKAEERRESHPDIAQARLPDGQAESTEASLLSGLPRTLPALLEAYQLTRRASRVGFDWENIEGLFEKLAEETHELRETLPFMVSEANPSLPLGTSGQADRQRVEEEVGDLLFVAVNVARFLGVDPEVALKAANRKFTARFQQMEQQARQAGRRLGDMDKDELEALWTATKQKRLEVATLEGRD